MPQYSATNRIGEVTASAVLDTATNSSTITVTASNGATTTITLSATARRATVAEVNAVFKALQADGFTDANEVDINNLLRSVQGRVVFESEQAATAATASNTSPPTSPAPVPTESTPQTQPTAAQEAFLEANAEPQSEPPTVANIVNTGVSREQAALLEANEEPISEPPQISRDQQALLEANQADEGTLASQASEVDTRLDLYSEDALGGRNPQSSEDNQRAVEEAVQQDEDNAEIARLQARGILAAERNTQSSATRQDIENAKARGDWRVRISLATAADYFYNSQDQEGILKPLAATDGVIFPYTPTISVGYTAQYQQESLTHTNYKTTQYTSSSVDNITIACDFTAQDTYEANYLLATIHFFRSLTKMWYGRDENPRRGTPPPLVYLHGYGDFQFNKHPMAVTGFTYSLPNDVDYIKCDTTSFQAGQPLFTNKRSSSPQARNAPTELIRNSNVVSFKTTQVQPTWVPTKIGLSITCIPVVSRYDVSNNFSLKDYASGALLRGNKEKWGGFW